MAGDMASLWRPLPAVSLAYFGGFSNLLDWALLVGFSVWRQRSGITRFIDIRLVAFPLLGAGILVFVIQSLAFISFLFDKSCTGNYNIGWPLIFPCNTTHRRVFPEKHAFEYSYLVVGIPVGWKGSAGGLVSADVPRNPKVLSWLRPKWREWFDVRDEDHMRRGSDEQGLRGKLDDFLKSEGVDASKYPYAYLITAPRFLGYSFNPVSFWYLYADNKELSAVVCEVNNTFDERRPYFLARDKEEASPLLGGTADSAERPLAKSSNSSAGSSKIRRSWTKDFHVSPFNSRKGFYSILASDPLSSASKSLARVDTTITLSSSKKHPKLVARLFSDGEPLDPTAMSPTQKLKLLLRWWWVGFVTFPRIVKEAAALFYSRGLHVWYRPEPLSTTLGRRGSHAELKLERLFREYLQFLVEEAEAPLRVKYIPSGSDAPTETMESPSVKSRAKDVEELEFKVLTPVFYTRFVQYAHDFEAIFSEFRESATISISNPDMLPNLLLKKPMPPLSVVNLSDFIYFKTIQRLRRRPERIERPLTSAALPTKTAPQSVDIRDFRLSSMDGYMLTDANETSHRTYRSVVTKVLVAERLAFGNVDILWMEGLILRLGTAWVLSTALAPFFTKMLGD